MEIRPFGSGLEWVGLSLVYSIFELDQYGFQD